MSIRDSSIFLKDIVKAIELINSYVDGLNFDVFEDDQKTIDAVLRNFQIIGEAA